jgi:hypothetical protein
MGALPDRLPGFQHVENDEVRARFDRAWGCAVPPRRGWHLSAMFEAMEHGALKALYVIGENPAQSEADQHKAAICSGARPADRAGRSSPTPRPWPTSCFRRRPAAFESEGTVTSSERRVQRVPPHARRRRARRATTSPSSSISPAALGHDWGEPDWPNSVWNELRTLSPVHAGMSYARLEAGPRSALAVLRRHHPGEAFLHSRLWERPLRGRARAVPSWSSIRSRSTRCRRLPAPPHHRPPAGRVQHRRADRRLRVADPAWRDARPVARGRRPLGVTAGRARARGVAPRHGRGAGARRCLAAAGPGLHDLPLPGAGGDQPAHHRRGRIPRPARPSSRPPPSASSACLPKPWRAAPDGPRDRRRRADRRGARRRRRAARPAGIELGGRRARRARRPVARGGHAARARRHLLLPALHALQDRGTAGSAEGGLNYICRRLAVPPAEAWGVVTFYHLFATTPRPPDRRPRVRRHRVPPARRRASSAPTSSGTPAPPASRRRTAPAMRRGSAAPASASASGARGAGDHGRGPRRTAGGGPGDAAA